MRQCKYNNNSRDLRRRGSGSPRFSNKTRTQRVKNASKNSVWFGRKFSYNSILKPYKRLKFRDHFLFILSK